MNCERFLPLSGNVENSALILTAAGGGQRFASALGPGEATKALYRIAGKAIFLHALEGLLEIPGLKHVIITAPPDEQASFEKAYQEAASSSSSCLNQGIPVSFLAGGRTRQESVYLGLQALAAQEEIPEWVWIHDAARCCVDQELVRALAQARTRADALTLGIPSADAIKCLDESGYVKMSLQREELVMVQTPQVFRTGRILHAHEQAARENKRDFADDAQMLEGTCKVFVVPGSRQNIKLTHPEDAMLVECILRSQGRYEEK